MCGHQFDAHKHAALVFEPIDAVFVYSLKAPMPRRPTSIVGHLLEKVDRDICREKTDPPLIVPAIDTSRVFAIKHPK